MRPDVRGMHRVGSSFIRRSISALRIVVDSSQWPWAKRRFLGEFRGVWLLAAVWVALVVLALTLFS